MTVRRPRTLRSGDAFATWRVLTNNGIWIDAANALAWRHAVESLGVEVRPYADDEEPVIYVNWSDADGGLVQSHRPSGFAPLRKGHQGQDLERRVRRYPTIRWLLTREWYESSEGFGRAQIHMLSIYGEGDPANPDDW